MGKARKQQQARGGAASGGAGGGWGGGSGQPNGSLVETMDREMVQSALTKRREGLQPSVREMAALRRWEDAKEEEARWKHYRSIPQKHWAKMSGRQWKVLREQAELYGIAFADAVIDLTKVVPQIHDFFAKHFRKFTALDPDAELLEGASKNVKDEYVRQQTRIARLKADEMEKKAVYWDALQPLLVDFGTGVRQAGEILQRQFGPDAAGVLDQALDEFDRKLAEMTQGNGAADHAERNQG